KRFLGATAGLNAPVEVEGIRVWGNLTQGIKLSRQPMRGRPRMYFRPNPSESPPPLFVGHVNRLSQGLGGPFNIQRRDQQCVSSYFGRHTARFREDDHPGPI